MIRNRRQLANRANARASTGPKTILGKARAAKNARKHGLAIPIASDRLLSSKATFLVEKLVGSDTAPEVHEWLQRFVEAQLDLNRVRRARHDIIARAFNDPYFVPGNSLMRRRRLLRVIVKNPRAVTDEELRKISAPTLEGDIKHVAILSEFGKRLAALDRYERQALSRRTSAVHALDAFGYQWPKELKGDLLKLIES